MGLGAVFEQKVDGVGWAPVAFWSRKLSEAEKRYSTTEKEWLAAVEAVTRQWRHWLGGRKFTLRSDHSALKQVLLEKSESFTARQLRWYDRLRDFSFEFQHLPGPSNSAADALSRSPVEVVSAIELQDEAASAKLLNKEEFIQAAIEDNDYQRLVQQIQRETGQQHKWQVTEQGLLVDGEGRTKIPNKESLRVRLILEAHEPPFCGHLGVSRTAKRVQQFWTWESVTSDVEAVVRSCDVCQRDSTKRSKNQAPLTTIIAEEPWEVVTMDFLNGLQKSRLGQWTGGVVVCDYTQR